MKPQDIELMQALARQEHRLSDKGKAKLDELRAQLPGQPGLAERLAIGAGRGFMDTYQGLKQRALQMTDPERADEYTQEVNRERADYDPIAAGYPYTSGLGRFVGNAASIPAPGAQGILPARLAYGAAIGAGHGAAQFTPGGTAGETAANTLMGAGGGLLGEGLFSAARGLRRMGGAGRAGVPSPRPGLPVPDQLVGGAPLIGPGPAAAERLIADLPAPAGPAPRRFDYADPEFGIPLTEGQYTGNLTRQQLEQRQAHAAFGEQPAQDILDFWRYQNQRGTDAFLDVGRDIVQGPRERALVPAGQRGGREYTGSTQAMGTMRERLSERAQALWRDTNEAFELARRAGGAVDVEEAIRVRDAVFAAPPENIRRGLASDPKAYPTLEAVRSRLEAFIPDVPEGQTARMDAEGLHHMRKILSEARADAGTSNTERRALGDMIEAIDQEMLRVLDTGKLIGPPEAITAIKEGIRLRADYGRLYGHRKQRYRSGRNRSDSSGQVIEDIIENRNMADEDVLHAVFGKGRLGTHRNTLGVLQRVKDAAGPDSEEFQALRNAVLERLREQVTQVGTDTISPQKLATQWMDLRRKRPELLGTLFNTDEISRIDRLVNAFAKTMYREEAQNRSRSAHMVEAIFKSLPVTMGAAAGAAGGGVPGAAAGAAGAFVAQRVGQDVRNALGKLFAVRTFERMPRGIPPTIGAAGAQSLQQYFEPTPGARGSR